MPPVPFEERPAPGRSSPPSSPRSPAAAPMLESDAPDSRAQSRVRSPESSEPLSESLVPLPPVPLMLEVADPESGELKPEFQPWSDQLPLEADGSLLPMWWPEFHPEASSQRLSRPDRAEWFQQSLESLVQARSESSSPDTALPTPPSSRPQAVLSSLLQLRSVVLPDLTPTPD